MHALIDTPSITPRCLHVASDDDMGVLQRIVEPSLNLCIWKRRANPATARTIEAILASKFTTRLDLQFPSPEEIASRIRATDPALATSLGVMDLATDVASLASLFARLAGTKHPRVRLDRVEDDGCALFHCDSLRLRMLCVYAGPGTQWLENSNVRRDQLGSHGRSIAEANAAIVVDAGAIQSIPNWHVAVFKGRAWDDGDDLSLIHRSAPVRHRGEYRIRLCIDLPNGCAC
ncbi:MAG: DUF1826 domain-containing protein [Chthoniobacterales bacterium]